MNRSREQRSGRFRRGETRQRLLAAAAPLIAERGWSRVTTRAVAERAGLPLGAVSYHFRGKHELLSLAALQVVEGAFPVSELAEVESLPQLLGLATSSMGSAGEPVDPVVSGVLLETMRESSRDPALRDRMNGLLGEYRRVLGELVRSEQGRGVVDDRVDPEAMATLIAAAGDGLLLHALVDPELNATAALDVLLTQLVRAQGGVAQQ